MNRLYVVLWSRTERGKQVIKASFGSARQAKAYVRQMEEYEGGWFVVRPYTDIDFISPGQNRKTVCGLPQNICA